MPRRELSCKQRDENEVRIAIAMDEYMDIDPSDSDADEQEVRVPHSVRALVR
jgi:hypothetical protein